MVIFFTAFTAAASPVVVKADITVKKIAVKNDSSKISVRSFDVKRINAYKENKAFIYTDDLPPESLWDRFWKWFWSLFDTVLKNKYAGSLITYAVIAVLVGLTIFLIIRFAGVDLKMITGRSKPVPIPYSESLDNIHEINFNDQIQQAIGNANYRLAVRLCYLSTLKKLSDQSLISWQPEKTNQHYISEIEDLNVKKQFSLLTTQFEYIWYGEFYIDKENFGEIKTSFDQFNPQKR